MYMGVQVGGRGVCRCIWVCKWGVRVRAGYRVQGRLLQPGLQVDVPVQGTGYRLVSRSTSALGHVYLTSDILHLTSRILHLASRISHLTSTAHILHLTSYLQVGECTWPRAARLVHAGLCTLYPARLVHAGLGLPLRPLGLYPVPCTLWVGADGTPPDRHGGGQGAATARPRGLACACVYVCMRACVHACMRACACARAYVCACMYVCMYVCMYATARPPARPRGVYPVCGEAVTW